MPKCSNSIVGFRSPLRKKAECKGYDAKLERKCQENWILVSVLKESLLEHRARFCPDI